MLYRHGVDEQIIAKELDAMSDVRLAATNNASIVRSMTDLEMHAEIRYSMESPDLVDLSLIMGDYQIGALRGRSGSPDRELAAVLGHDRSSSPRPKPSATTTSGTAAVYQLKVTLLNTKPPIWRRLLVDGSSTLDQVHEVIQAAFGWWNAHLHDFEVGRTRYGIPDPDWDFGPPTRDERDARLDEIAVPGTSFRYTYDFGDHWEHDIKVEKAIDPDPKLRVPDCIGGRRACPPEDCGGPWGYQNLLTILDDPTHPEHADLFEWAEQMREGGIDPEAFDPGDFDTNLREVRLVIFPE